MNRIKIYLDQTVKRITFALNQTPSRISLYVQKFSSVTFAAISHIDYALDVVYEQMSGALSMIHTDIDISFAAFRYWFNCAITGNDIDASTMSVWCSIPVLADHIDKDMSATISTYHRWFNAIHVDYNSSITNSRYTKPIVLSEYTFSIGDSSMTLKDWCFTELV